MQSTQRNLREQKVQNKGKVHRFLHRGKAPKRLLRAFGIGHWEAIVWAYENNEMLCLSDRQTIASQSAMPKATFFELGVYLSGVRLKKAGDQYPRYFHV